MKPNIGELKGGKTDLHEGGIRSIVGPNEIGHSEVRHWLDGINLLKNTLSLSICNGITISPSLMLLARRKLEDARSMANQLSYLT